MAIIDNKTGRRVDTGSGSRGAVSLYEPWKPFAVAAPAAQAAQGSSAVQKTTPQLQYEEPREVAAEPMTASRLAKILTGAGKSAAGSYASALGTTQAVTGGVARKNYLTRDMEQWQKELETYRYQAKNADDPEEQKYFLRQAGETASRIEAAKENLKETETAGQAMQQTAKRLSEDAGRDIAQAKEGLGTVGSLLVDAGVAGTQMLGDAALGAVTGGGTVLPLFLRSAGGAAQEAREAGATLGQQVAYGLGSGGVSAAAKRLLNVASPLKKIYGEGLFDRAVTKAAGKLGQSAAGKAALAALSEGGEEFAEAMVQPLLQRATYDKNAVYDDEWLAGALHDAAVGAVLGGIGGGVDIAVSRAQAGAKAQNGAMVSTGETTAQEVGVDATGAGNAVRGGSGAAAAPVKVGRVTTIQSPYAGTKPVQESKNAAAVTVDSGSVEAAKNRIEGARGIEARLPNQGFKSTLKNAYKSVFKAAKGVSVEGVTFEGRPYLVDINSNVPGKVISDKNLTAEKLALLDVLPEIVRKGEYVGSGEYVRHGTRNKPVVRYDYFETPVEINGKAYIAKFDVEAYPAVNNYRTHQIVDVDLTPSEGRLAGQAPVPSSDVSSPPSDTTVSRQADFVNKRKEGTTSKLDTAVQAAPNHTSETLEPVPSGHSMPQSGGDVNRADPRPMGNTIGSAQAGFAGRYTQLQNARSEFHDEGANAARPVDVPTTDFDGRSISKSASTAMGAQAIPDEVVPMIEEMVAAGELSYDTRTDKDALETARATVADKGFDGALEQFREGVRSGKASKHMAVLGQVLLNNAANAKDGRATAEILALYQTLNTNVGQSLQAMSIFRKLSPESQLYGVQRSVANMKEAMEKELGRGGDIEIDPELVAKFLEQEDQEGRDAVMREIYQNVADQVPATWMDKWNAWRYLAMLGNPRTHVRNMLGNAFFQPVRIIKDQIGAAAEAAFSAAGVNVERTKSFGLSPALYRAAWNDYGNVKSLLGGSKASEVRSEVERRRRIFKTGALEKARTANTAAMEWEDAIFKRVTYADALAGYLRANGVTAAQLEGGTADGKLMSRARDYAAKEALKATYQDSNAISRKATEIGKATGAVGDAILPFKRTPANVLARGLEYSPLGLAKALTRDMAQVKQGKMSAAQALDSVAAGLTGTGLFTLGMYLFAEGLVTGGQGDSEEDKWAELLGHQGYAWEGRDGTSVTLDWLAPAALPFFMGVELMSAAGEGGFQTEDIAEAALSMSEPLLEMSMLQSLSDLIDSVSYAESSKKIPSMIGSALVSYLSQAIPTVGGQIERSGEDVRMTTYTEKDNTLIPTDLQYALGKASARIPGVEYQQIPYIDAWGREEGSGDVLMRSINNLANPAYVSQVAVGRVEQELQRLYDATGAAAVFPDRAARSVSVNGERRNLTAAQYVAYAKALGQGRYTLAKEAMESPAYREMDEAGKAAFIEKMYSLANADAIKGVFSEYALSAEMQGYADARAKGLTAAAYYAYREGMAGITADKDEDGKSISGSKKEKVMADINAMQASKKQKDFLFALQYPKGDLEETPWH